MEGTGCGRDVGKRRSEGNGKVCEGGDDGGGGGVRTDEGVRETFGWLRLVKWD